MKAGYKITHDILNEKPSYIKLSQWDELNHIVLYYCSNKINHGGALKGIWHVKYKK